jgi:hypothetical protein
LTGVFKQNRILLPEMIARSESFSDTEGVRYKQAMFLTFRPDEFWGLPKSAR